MRMSLLGLAVILAASPGLAADAKPRAHNLVYLGPQRPVLLRVHLELDGQPFEPGRIPGLDRLFAFLDRDGDGVLGSLEVNRAPRAQVLSQVRMGYGLTFFNIQGAGTTATLADMDMDRDDEVSFEEFADYYSRNGMTGLQVTVAPSQGVSPAAVTDELYKLLDHDRDGKLSREEIEAGGVVLARADQNDDERLSLQEILPSLINFGFGQFNQPAVGQPGGPVLQFDPSDVSRNPVDRLIAAYDKDQDKKLTRAEIGLSQADFDALDTTRDGELVWVELAHFARRTPEVEVLLRLGKREPGVPSIQLCGPEGKPLSLPAAARQPDDNSLQAAAAEMLLNVRAADTALGNLPLVRQNAIQQFKTADVNKDGMLDGTELQNNRLTFYLRPVLQLGDVNGDGKLTEQEVLDFLQLQEGLVGGNVALVVADNSTGLFEALDANRDGNLTLRELRTAWERLAAFDRDGDGRIARAEIPRQVQFAFNAGVPSSLGGRPAQPVLVRGGMAPVTNPAPSRGPLWFRKMDRNGDGDVSAREFLGTAADFQRIDENGDGLIDLAEAEKADAAMRKAAEASR